MIVPFPESSLNQEAGKVFMENYNEYFNIAKIFTQVHASRKDITKTVQNIPKNSNLLLSSNNNKVPEKEKEKYFDINSNAKNFSFFKSINNNSNEDDYFNYSPEAPIKDPNDNFPIFSLGNNNSIDNKNLYFETPTFRQSQKENSNFPFMKNQESSPSQNILINKKSFDNKNTNNSFNTKSTIFNNNLLDLQYSQESNTDNNKSNFPNKEEYQKQFSSILQKNSFSDHFNLTTNTYTNTESENIILGFRNSSQLSNIQDKLNQDFTIANNEISAEKDKKVYRHMSFVGNSHNSFKNNKPLLEDLPFMRSNSGISSQNAYSLQNQNINFINIPRKRSKKEEMKKWLNRI